MLSVAAHFPTLFGMPGGGELIVILIVGLLVFGGKLPEVARNIGKSVQEFKRGIKDLDREVGVPFRESLRAEPPAASVPYQPPRLTAGSATPADPALGRSGLAAASGTPVESAITEPAPKPPQ